MSITIEITVCLEVTQTGHSSTTDIDIVDGNVAAAARSAKNVIVPSLIRSSTGNVSDGDVGNVHASGRIASGAAIEVVLLDINTIYRDILNADVLKQDVVDRAGGVLVGLNAGTVFRIQYDRIAENHVGYVIVGLSTDRTDGQAVTAVAVHVVDNNVVTTSDCYTVILVDNDTVANLGIIGRGEIKAITVVRSWQTV